jgi:hypothetical protein
VGYVVDVNKDAIVNAILQYFTEQKEAAFTEQLKVEKTKVHMEVFMLRVIKISACLRIPD